MHCRMMVECQLHFNVLCLARRPFDSFHLLKIAKVLCFNSNFSFCCATNGLLSVALARSLGIATMPKTFDGKTCFTFTFKFIVQTKVAYLMKVIYLKVKDAVNLSDTTQKADDVSSKDIGSGDIPAIAKRQANGAC